MFLLETKNIVTFLLGYYRVMTVAHVDLSNDLAVFWRKSLDVGINMWIRISSTLVYSGY